MIIQFIAKNVNAHTYPLAFISARVAKKLPGERKFKFKIQNTLKKNKQNKKKTGM